MMPVGTSCLEYQYCDIQALMLSMTIDFFFSTKSLQNSSCPIGAIQWEGSFLVHLRLISSCLITKMCVVINNKFLPCVYGSNQRQRLQPVCFWCSVGLHRDKAVQQVFHVLYRDFLLITYFCGSDIFHPCMILVS